MTWWRITAPHFVAGLAVKAGVVVEAAPILRWTRGRPWAEIKEYMKRKRWHGSASTPRTPEENGD